MTVVQAETTSQENTRRVHSEARRQRILAAARECFGREGYAGATIGRIAAQAGVSNGLLYQFYRSKDHLLDVVLKEVVRDWVRALVPQKSDMEQPGRALELMFRRSVEFCSANPLLSGLLSGDPALQLQRLAVASEDRLEAHRELVGSILERGISLGEFNDKLDVTSVADLIVLLTAEYSRRAYAPDPRFPSTAKTIDAVVAFILRGVAD